MRWPPLPAASANVPGSRLGRADRWRYRQRPKRASLAGWTDRLGLAVLPLVLADRIQLQQVVLNLIINGIEAMNGISERRRELRVSTERDGSNGVITAVRDSGVGLNPESLEHLFDPFYTTKPDGMGMGLAISRSIIEAHGGRLWATLNAPCGAVLQFTLPHDGERIS